MPKTDIHHGPIDSESLEGPPLICLSHLRWNFVFQRPHHLMTRFARRMPIYFVEEPVFDADVPALICHRIANGVTLLVPHLPASTPHATAANLQKQMLHELCSDAGITAPVLWFYTPEALRYANTLPAAVTVFDCMDELSAFAGASPDLPGLEAELLRRADVVFTGGISLYEAKRERHNNIHPFPSAVDAPHFRKARKPQPEQPDQTSIPHPRVGFFGVIDERLDRDLLAEVARLRPEWHFVLVGPVAKIDPKTLPQATNIHYLGRKHYEELPSYIAGWDAAMMPFARNEATCFISPTKTPEYLAAGRPVVSTPIVDVVRSWGHLDAVRIGDTASAFVTGAEAVLSLAECGPEWLIPVDAELEQLSWERTWEQMAGLVAAALRNKHSSAPGASTALPCAEIEAVKGEVRV